jgi:phospholipid/cholesterol/gamma-HCH transport system substrate-binding protein
VTLSFQGLTGVASIVLEGGAPDAPPLPVQPGKPPLLVAGVAASQDTMQAARQALQHFDQILADNAAPLKNAIANLSNFSDALARNSDRIDKIAAGLEQTFGAQEEEASPANYGLSPPDNFPPITKVQGQLVVAQPTALIVFDTQRILARSGGAISAEFEGARWSDTIPLLVQSTMVRAFENAGYPHVSAPIEGLATCNQLLIDIRDFTITAGPQTTAQVELEAKILDENGAIAGAQAFQASAPVSANTAASAAAALDEAFREVATNVVIWTLGVI